MGTRDADLEQLDREYKQTKDPGIRKAINEAGKKIRKEGYSKPIKGMREALVKAHRSGDVDEVKDIHERIKGKSKYQND